MSNCPIPDCYLDGPHEHTVSTGRIFNHRDGMAELRRFEMENKAMSPEERAETLRKSLQPYFYIEDESVVLNGIISQIADQIKLAVEEAYQRGENVHLATCSERFDEGFRAGEEQSMKPDQIDAITLRLNARYVEGFLAGELAMRERAARVMGDRCQSNECRILCWHEGAIGALSSSNPKGEK